MYLTTKLPKQVLAFVRENNLEMTGTWIDPGKNIKMAPKQNTQIR